MSRIFDALRRSESERTGSDLDALPKGPDLLSRAERLAASKWGDASFDKEPETTIHEEADGRAAQDAVRAAVATGDLALERVALRETERAEFLSRFQSLSIAPPSQSRVVCLTDRENPTAEALRLLAVRLKDLRRVRPLKKVLITSTIPQEGKSTIASNLACALAQAADERVLLVDGDLRRPSLSQIFGISKTRGLSEWLRDDEAPCADIYRLDAAGIWILPAGNSRGHSLESLQSQRLPVLVEQLAEYFDWIIVDSPPVLPLADTSVWMRLSDGILLVTRQGTTEKKLLTKGLDAIDQQKLLGALLNGTVASAYSGYYYSSPPS
jgi:capsular exopolysaccharide synthesis family protein